MKPLIIILAFTLCIMNSDLFAQISSGKTSFDFNNAPVLSIEQVTFSDMNMNQMADAEETCFLTVKLKNSGKSAAKSVNLQLNRLDTSNSYLSFKKSFAVGMIKMNETKEIKIPLSVNTSFEDAKTIIEIIATELNNFDSKPVQHTISIKAAEASIAVNWDHPQTTETTVDESNYTLKACIISAIKLDQVELYINNRPFKPARGFLLSKKDPCMNYFEQQIILERGNNLIQLIAKNKLKRAESEIRNIIFNDPNFEYRTALVIGNRIYEDAPLKNSVNDAKAMAETLRELNFDVIEITDGDLSAMRKGIRDFYAKLEEKKGVALFYYAGHGIQSKGENYLIPVNHDIKEEFEIPERAIRINSVLEAMESTNTRMNIVILDACRNNPFLRSMRSGTRGLAQIYAEGTGSIIAYATAPGSVASDGDGQNGLYTQELLKAIKTPGLEIGMVFRKVLTNVKKLSNGQQLPWTNSSIEGEFYFKK